MSRQWLVSVLMLLVGFSSGYFYKPTPIVAAQTNSSLPINNQPQTESISVDAKPTEPEPVIEKPKNSPSAAEKIEKIKALPIRDAIDYAKREMSDIQGEGVSAGAAFLALWSSYSLKWADLQTIEKGKYGLVMKDSSTQIGRRLCMSGSVIEIERDRTVSQPIFIGGLIDNEGKIYRFVAVGSTGEIVGGTNAKFCGIIAGQQHYANSIGGVAHAVALIGMFDLPENKKG
ncbi:MAG: hypothetical protein CTY21_09395 [Methylomonas sp.]|nr:MAG: hypothetical protein CTY21_09395 [Methylomonas sp.]